MRDLDEILDLETLDLPISGRIYSVPEPSEHTGLLVHKLTSRAVAAKQGAMNIDTTRVPELVGDEDEEDLYRRLLSDEMFDAIISDGVSWPRIKRSAMTVIVRIVGDLEAAEKV